MASNKSRTDPGTNVSATHITGTTNVTGVVPAEGDEATDNSLVVPWLVVVGGTRIGEALQLPVGDPIVIGRDKSLPLALKDQSVSRKHVEITAVAVDEAQVRDLGSTNGTFVNGQPISTTQIGPGDRIQLGSTAVLRLTLRDKSESSDSVPVGTSDSSTRRTHAPPTPRRGRGSGPVIVGGSAALLATMGLAEQVAKTDSSVLIVGETGTGKELVARAIHEASTRRNGPFVAVDLSSVAPSLIEGSLFGYLKGAFTGASRTTPGIVEAARGGTLFLDEIGDLDLPVQAKLLRVLQERTYVQIGSNVPRDADFRLVCATLRDLDHEVQENRFREDLLYRIDVVRIVTPPLRERTCDIEPLARSFLARFCYRDGRDPLELSPSALEELQSYHWPGNVRELEHTIERAVALTPDGQSVGSGLVNWRKERSPLSASVDEDYNHNRGLDELLADVEKRILADAMTRFGGNRTAVAAKLRLPRTTLRHKLKKYGLS